MIPASVMGPLDPPVENERTRVLRQHGFTRAKVWFRMDAECWPSNYDSSKSVIDGFARRRGADVDVADPTKDNGELPFAPVGQGFRPIYTTFPRSDIARIEWAEPEDASV